MYLPDHGLQTGDVYGAVCYPAHSRLAGAMQEMLADPEQKIARPRQIYTGHDVREFLPMEKRAPVAATKH
jgi:citrate synthase